MSIILSISSVSSEKRDKMKVMMPPNLIYRSTELSFEGLKASYSKYIFAVERSLALNVLYLIKLDIYNIPWEKFR